MIEISLANNSDDNVAWKEIIVGYLKYGEVFEVHCWKEEEEQIAIMKEHAQIEKTDWNFGVVLKGIVTAEFTNMLLSLPKPTDNEIYNKMTPFFSIFVGSVFNSEHYGTEISIVPNAEKPYKCRCCNQNTFAVPPDYSLGYICPVCYWEDDAFLQGSDEPSDLNKGVTLNEARNNYKEYGAFSKDLISFIEKFKP